MPPLSRRRFLGSLAGLPIALSHPVLGSVSQSRFLHGVASGDPDHRSVVIWTRVESEKPVSVDWEVASDSAFRNRVASGSVLTNAYRDYTVKTVVEGLEPGAEYFYRFGLEGETSDVGSTRTLPLGSLSKLTLALASCSNYPFGFFNAYEAISEDAGIDFVLHTGDYIYEYGADDWGGDVGRQIGRVHLPHHEIVTLADYRMRHAQYKRDVGSRAMHRSKPLLMLWDDHESANNPWIGGAQNHQPNEGLWYDRRNASIQAYYEWMPIREPGIGQDRMKLWRHYEFGDLASLITMESRHTARALQVDYGQYFRDITSASAARKFEQDVLGAAHRNMLSDEMTLFAQNALKKSKKRKQPWRVLGNAIPMARVRVPDVGDKVNMPDGAPVPGTSADALWKGKYNMPFYLDTWDGYPWAREKFYEDCRKVGVNDLLVLTGDSHSFWSNQLFDRRGRSMGLELGTAGISSPGDFVESGFELETAAKLDKWFAEHNPEVVWTDNMHQGFVRLEMKPEATDVEFRSVSTVLKRSYLTDTIRKETIVKDKDAIKYV